MRSSASRSSRRRRRRRGDRDPPGRQPGDELGPPRLRRRLRRRLPRSGSRRSSRPRTGRPSCDASRLRRPLRVRWLGRVPYREALAVQTALFDTAGAAPAAARASARVHPRARAPTCDEPAVRARCGRRRAWSPSSGAATSPTTARASSSGTRSSTSTTAGRRPRVRRRGLVIDALAELGLPNAGRLAGYAGVWLDAGRPTPARSRDRRPAEPGPDDARVRPQRDDRHGLHARAHRAVRDRRPAGHVARRGGHRRVDARGCRRRRPARRRAWADGAIERQDVAWSTPPTGATCRRSRAARARRTGRRSRRRGRSPARGGRVSPTGCRSRPASPTGCARRSARPRGAGAEEDDPLARPRHGVRGRRVPEPVRVLVRRHRHVHGARRALHAGVRFCLVDTRQPARAVADEPDRVAEAIDRMALDHAVLTMVARDDLADGGMAHVAACVEAIRAAPGDPGRDPDLRRQGSTTLARRAVRRAPDVLNHNVETVARLQRAVRPSAGYARIARRCWPGPRRRARRPRRASWSASARPTPRSSAASPTSPTSASTS